MMEERERNGKDDNSRRIAILVFRVRGSLPPLFDLLPPFFSFFFFERVTLIGWMRVVPRLRLLEIREICRTGENWLAKRQAKERNESTFQSIMFHRRVSIREDPGTRMCKDLSLLLFPIASTDPIVGNSFDRDDAANLDF